MLNQLEDGMVGIENNWNSVKSRVDGDACLHFFMNMKEKKIWIFFGFF